MAHGSSIIDGLSNEERRVFESLISEFNQRWRVGLLASQVGRIPPGARWRLDAIVAMVKIDLELQWRTGREIGLETYLEQFPELGRPDDVSADLILIEYEVRRRLSGSVKLEDYFHRFPAQAAELARLIASGGSSMLGDAARRSSAGVVATARLTAADLGIPERLGRYRIIRRLGQGGMGSVYLAEDTQLGRRVALKVPHFGPDDGAEARERFFREARTAATLDHPYLCPVYDVGEADGRLYLTMAFIEGKSLAESLRGEGLPTRQVAALVGKLALALQQAHTKGIVHRDLKPANVMIKTDGKRREPVIVDFGLAFRDDAEDARITKSGQVMGTLAYMAPEQVMGDLSKIGPASDIYALGVILYELLTGRLPFNGAGLAIAGQILTQPPMPPHSFRPELDPRIEAICLKAMAKKAGDRHATMGVLAAELTGFLKEPSATPDPDSVAPTTRRPARAAPSKKAGDESLMAQFFEGLEGEAYSIGPKPAPAPRTRSARPVWSQPDDELEVSQTLTRRKQPRGDRPRWLLPAVAVPVVLLGLVLAWRLNVGPGVALYQNDRPFEVPVEGPSPRARSTTEGKPEAAKSSERAKRKDAIPPTAPRISQNVDSPSPGAFETPNIRPTLVAPYRNWDNSPVADGIISPEEYPPGVEVTFEPNSRFACIGKIIDADRNASKTPQDLSARLFASYSDTSLFLAFRVRDQYIDADEADQGRPHLNDAVELFIDGDRVANDFITKAGSGPVGSSEGFQLIADVAGHQLTSLRGATNADWKVGTKRVSDGYVIEFEIPLRLIDVRDGAGQEAPGPGSLIHLGVAIDDSDAPANAKWSFAYLRARNDVNAPYYGCENAWTLGIRLEPRPSS